MADRYCVCGKYIYHTKVLCEDCVKEYGTDRDSWEPWLFEWVKSMDREVKVNSRHHYLPVFDETESGRSLFLSGDAISNLSRAMYSPEMDFEDFAWRNV